MTVPQYIEHIAYYAVSKQLHTFYFCNTLPWWRKGQISTFNNQHWFYLHKTFLFLSPILTFCKNTPEENIKNIHTHF